MILPGFEPAETVFLSPGIPLRFDLERKLDQVASAEIVLIAKGSSHTSFLDLWPEFRDALDGCDLINQTSHLLIYARLRPPKVPAKARGQTRVDSIPATATKSLGPVHGLASYPTAITPARESGLAPFVAAHGLSSRVSNRNRNVRYSAAIEMSGFQVGVVGRNLRRQGWFVGGR